ncbi:hypothetical protein AB0V79_25265 [Mesorhizobium ciceri]|uniref:hypothetical protein n=1 Tax=Mesorhizobium TaxID=68287 RepID=UPI000B2EBA74|nr:hypothetical protein [Mesorhizobium ciceri]
MKTDLSAYAVTELSPEEASSISGGFFWILGAVTLLAFVAASIGELLINHGYAD